MELLNSLGLLLGGSRASGINLYMTIAGLGIAHRMELITLPGNADVFAHPPVIGAAILMYGIEFFADKIPYVDSCEILFMHLYGRLAELLWVTWLWLILAQLCRFRLHS